MDLAVLGTHGRSGFERLMLGSVAAGVLQKAECNLLIVPPVLESEEHRSGADWTYISDETPVLSGLSWKVPASTISRGLPAAVTTSKRGGARMWRLTVHWSTERIRASRYFSGKPSGSSISRRTSARRFDSGSFSVVRARPRAWVAISRCWQKRRA